MNQFLIQIAELLYNTPISGRIGSAPRELGFQILKGLDDAVKGGTLTEAQVDVMMRAFEQAAKMKFGGIT